MPVTEFLSAQTGAPVLSGTAGALTDLLDHVLCVGRAFSYDGSTYIDNSAEARLDGGTAFALLPDGDASDDAFYIGGCAKFAQLILELATAGVGGAYAIEYWNGAAWTAVVASTDGTSGLTQDGTISWVIASQTGWATTAVNAVTQFWVRLRATSAPGTNPTCLRASIYGWSIAYTGTNKRAYRSLLANGVRHYFRVQDDAPGAGGGREARVRAYETMSDIDTGTAPFPTVAQFANGLFIRKSTTADATARSWCVYADDKTVYGWALTADTAGRYYGFGFGEFFSLVAGDLYRSFLSARNTENSALGTVEMLVGNRMNSNSGWVIPAGGSAYVARGYTGVASSIAMAIVSGLPHLLGTNGTVEGGAGQVATFNGPDGGIVIGPSLMLEPTWHVRGRLRGLFEWAHAFAAVEDADTFAGTGLLAAKTFRCLKTLQFHGTSLVANGVLVVETSDGWETN